MKSPITNKEMKLITEKRSFKFRKIDFEVDFQTYICEDSQEKFTSKELDEVNFAQIYNQYREKFHIPFTEEIISLRKKYGLSAKKMSELLGFGENQYSLYENGEIPSISNATTIKLAQEPSTFLRLINDKKEIFTEQNYKKVQNKVEEEINLNKENIQEKYIENYILDKKNATIFTGYTIPNWQKIANIIVYFSKEMKPLKTTLNKLMFYADFLNYKNTGKSISGLTYKAIQYGNVPNNFELIFSKAEKENYIKIDYNEFKNGNVGEIFQNIKIFEKELFSDQELESLQQVLEKFKLKNRQEIVDICHEETSWIDNNKNKIIFDYSYAFTLKAF